MPDDEKQEPDIVWVDADDKCSACFGTGNAPTPLGAKPEQSKPRLRPICHGTGRKRRQR